MSWEEVYDVIAGCGGRLEEADPAKIAAATLDGPGDRETQIRIAEKMYRRDMAKIQRKEAKDGQKRLHFA